MTRPPQGWRWLHARIRPVAPLLLCLDYDGTLVPLAAHPAEAVLSASRRRLLQQLAGQRGVSVALISGRALRDLKRLVGLRGLCYVGNHGLELQGAGLRYRHPAAGAGRPLPKALAPRLTAALRGITGAWVEDKGLTLSLHWRAVPRSAHRRFHAAVARATAPYLQDGTIRLTRGKRVIEIRPRTAWGKGEVVTWLLGARRPPRPFPIYFGDDQTDEDAFRSVNRQGGLSVAVGPSPRRRSAAHWRLRNSKDVGEALTRILEARWQSPPAC